MYSIMPRSSLSVHHPQLHQAGHTDRMQQQQHVQHTCQAAAALCNAAICVMLPSLDGGLTIHRYLWPDISPCCLPYAGSLDWWCIAGACLSKLRQQDGQVPCTVHARHGIAWKGCDPLLELLQHTIVCAGVRPTTCTLAAVAIADPSGSCVGGSFPPSPSYAVQLAACM
jgi:hypothetical protein